MAFAPFMIQVPLALAAVSLALAWQWYSRWRSRVLLLDFSCYKPPDDLQVNLRRFMRGLSMTGVSLRNIA